MLDLKSFQSQGAKLISDRYAFYANHPDRPRKGNKPRPFFQALSALTGAGKTPILAQAVMLMRGHFAVEPIVLWMSKAKSVVAQTYTNFSEGGKYNCILDDFQVVNIQNITPHLISDGTSPLIIMTTTGLFNNKDQSEGALNIYKKDPDSFGETSPWDRLIARLHEGKRRPLLIVYDEGHNLSEQQTELLAELEPDAYLLASATLKLPINFNRSVIQQIKSWVEEAGNEPEFVSLKAISEVGKPEPEFFITTTIASEDVVDAELVKKAIQFDGSTASMESCLDDLTKRLSIIQSEIDCRGLGFKPKAIYVCKTNITDDGEKDDASKPFEERQAPPIRIWRYLVSSGISPKDIAIYANLSFDKNKPDEVNLFSKGENDFDEFSSRDFQHIIFNLSLQEGWDDPACYLAYIDKSMGSSIQVEQIIGRTLRQYGATHYENPLLNSAHFFIRVDKQSVFSEAIENVKAKLQKEGAPIEITSNFGGVDGGADDLYPKEDVHVKLHHVHIDAETAQRKVADIIGDFPAFTEHDVNTFGVAHTASHLVELTEPGKNNGNIEWEVDGNTNPVRLRWLINSAIKSHSARVLSVVDLSDAKFDVRVQVQSKANKLGDKMAQEVVDAYFQYSDLVYEGENPFSFGTLRVAKKAPTFNNGLYERYAGFNKFELTFANAIDEIGCTWHRNPSSGGFYIPLLSSGDTNNFYPDFIAWANDYVFCLDTKGGHLLSDAVARKLFDVTEDGKTKLHVRFITEGKQTELRGKAIKGGYTVWKMKTGSPKPIFFEKLAEAIVECLK
ncbi:MAG: DEAD/DEAH box helicase family protein [Methylococcales bacterium]|nr:DEAD/DEAH box helicase family protein [Methylococcales bacterium]